MGIPLSSLSSKLGSAVVDSDIFLISNFDSTSDNKISREDFSKAFTGFYAQGSEGFTIFESTSNFGLSVSGSNGFVGINDRTPSVSLDVVDNISATNGSGQIKISTPDSGRKIAFSISDPNVYYEFSKKPDDTKLYIESSINGGSTFTNLAVIDQSGNFALHGTTGALTDKFLVSGDSIQFQNSGNAIYIDPYNTEIKTSASDETLLLNYNNLGDINIGYNAIYVDNSASSQKIGIGHAIPAYTLHVSGSIGEVSRFQSNTSRCVSSYRTSTSTYYFGAQGATAFMGPVSILDEKNLVVAGGNGFVGIGTTGPLYKLDVKASGTANYTPAYFQNNNVQGSCQIVVAANKAFGGGDTGPRNSLVTFSRYDGAPDVDKWSIGNIKNDTTFGGSDDFVFIKNGYFGTSPDVVAKLSTAGDLDIDGSYSTNSNYCKGKFIQVYETKVTGNNIYFNPLIPASSPNPSGHDDNNSPFAIALYGGRIEKIILMTSDTACVGYDYRFEISAITQTYNPSTPNGFVSGFSVSPPTDPVAYPTSGIIGATYFDNLVPNTNYTKLRTNISGSTSFSAGQLLQFRLCESNGTKSDPIDFTVLTAIAYTIN